MAATSGEGRSVRGSGGTVTALAVGCVGNPVEWHDFALYGVASLAGPLGGGYALPCGDDEASPRIA